ncbi:MAG TPA: CoA transferase [Chloroflexota bacterium]|nr:CoA transferase [Chloroflexota bacterium]
MARVIDLTSPIAAYACRLLAETGHDVVRVEPRSGDALRRMGPFLGGDCTLENGAFHTFLNARKRSFTPDLSTGDGQRVALELVARSDAVVASLPLPIDEPLLRAANPNLVLVRVDDGEPEACVYARSGLLALTGHPGQRPSLMGGHVANAATSLHVAVAASAALLVQQLAGTGQTVDVSARECLMSLAEQSVITYTSSGRVTERRGYRGAVTAISGAFPCADGYWMLSVPSTAERWANFMEWVQDPDLMADASLLNEAERNEKKDFVLDRLTEWSARFPKNELVQEAQSRHIPASPVSTPLDLVSDPQLIARGFLRDVEHPDLGAMRFPIGALALLWGTEPGFAPRLGQHNGEILTELGYTAAQQRSLVESGAM